MQARTKIIVFVISVLLIIIVIGAEFLSYTKQQERFTRIIASNEKSTGCIDSVKYYFWHKKEKCDQSTAQVKTYSISIPEDAQKLSFVSALPPLQTATSGMSSWEAWGAEEGYRFYQHLMYPKSVGYSDGIDMPYIDSVNIYSVDSVSKFFKLVREGAFDYEGYVPAPEDFKEIKKVFDERSPSGGYGLKNFHDIPWIIADGSCIGEGCRVHHFYTFVGDRMIDVDMIYWPGKNTGEEEIENIFSAALFTFKQE